MGYSGGNVCAIVPARDEEGSIQAVVRNARAAGAATVHVIVNGSTDRTAELALAAWSQVRTHVFEEPLGLDVPRAVGAALCLACEGFMALPAGAVLFLDGDMAGPLGTALRGLVEPVLDGRLDLSLMRCSAGIETGPNAARVTGAILALNRRLGLSGSIGNASPSHGPFACSTRLLRRVAPRDFATPPLLLTRAVLNGLAVGVGASLRHEALGSPYRGAAHASLVAGTIIGDCAEALAVFEGTPKTRVFEGKDYPGLNRCRRFDVLESVVRSILG
ncbi:MAG: glycosyl transferase family 2 [Ignavibacteriales bacterium]